MKVKEIVKSIIKENPELLGAVSQKQAIAIIREVFAQLVKKLDAEAEKEEVVSVQGLGRFRTRIIEKEKEGKKISEKRTIFRPASKDPEKTEKLVEESE